MYEIYGPLNREVYLDLVRLLIKRSNSFLISLPNMGKTMVNERNAKLMQNYPIGYSIEENQDLHFAYVKWTDRYINLIKDNIIQRYTDTGYLDQTTSVAMEIIHVSIGENTIDFFSQTDDFSKWTYPAFPENPCFLSNGKCIFQCIAHENLCIIYIDDKEIKSFLKKRKISYAKYSNQQVPNINS